MKFRSFEKFHKYFKENYSDGTITFSNDNIIWNIIEIKPIEHCTFDINLLSWCGTP